MDKLWQHSSVKSKPETMQQLLVWEKNKVIHYDRED